MLCRQIRNSARTNVNNISWVFAGLFKASQNFQIQKQDYVNIQIIFIFSSLNRSFSRGRKTWPARPAATLFIGGWGRRLVSSSVFRELPPAAREDWRQPAGPHRRENQDDGTAAGLPGGQAVWWSLVRGVVHISTRVQAHLISIDNKLSVEGMQHEILDFRFPFVNQLRMRAPHDYDLQSCPTVEQVFVC